jgi:hypothetical protein
VSALAFSAHGLLEWCVRGREMRGIYGAREADGLVQGRGRAHRLNDGLLSDH